MHNTYDQAYYKQNHITAEQSAAIIIPCLLNDWIQPKSVIDLGCGTGTWLAEFKRNGITNIKGIDGDWIPRNQLKITPEEFTPHDLTQPYTTIERYDLAISLETAQHLEEIYTRTFITSLCNTSNIIMFSAARPDQHGIGHVNEQPPDYWIKLFAEQGYNFKLHFGWQFNDNNNVSRCYVQNLMILAKETS